MIKWNLVLRFYITLLIPTLYLINLALAYFTPNTMPLPYWVVLIGLLIASAGIVFWSVSFFNLRKSFGVLPLKQKRVKTGLYKYLRHPMYIGIYLTFFGLSVAKESWQGLVFLNLVILPILLIRVVLEEKELRD